MIRKALVALAAFAFTATTAHAAGMNGATFSKDKRITSVPHGSTGFTPAVVRHDDLTTIWSNLGTAYPKGTYFCCYGYTVSGPDSLIGQAIWEAAAFTPGADGVVSEVDVAIGWTAGTNDVRIDLYTDNAGVPGTRIKGGSATGLPVFGDCCGLATVTFPKGAAVAGGTQYWVVVSTNHKNKDTWAAWNMNSTDQIDPVTVASGDGTSWQTFGAIPAPSFGVFGQ